MEVWIDNSVPTFTEVRVWVDTRNTTMFLSISKNVYTFDWSIMARAATQRPIVSMAHVLAVASP